jgi:hypothetical protein
MNRNAVTKPFRFPVFVVVLAVMIMACASDGGGGGGGQAPHDYVYVSLSRVRGAAHGHFASHIELNSDFITDPVWTVEGLPPGITFNERNRMIEGDGPEAGIWNFKVSVYDRVKGIPSEPAPATPAGSRVNYWNFEVVFFSTLEEPR